MRGISFREFGLVAKFMELNTAQIKYLYSIYLLCDLIFHLQEMHVHPKSRKDIKGSVGAPMPGEVLEVRVKTGDKVAKGDPIAVVSAMKMEMVVAAPVSGTIKDVLVSPGSPVEGDDLLVEIEE